MILHKFMPKNGKATRVRKARKFVTIVQANAKKIEHHTAYNNPIYTKYL